MELAKEVAAVKLLASIEGSEVRGLPTTSASCAVVRLADLVAEHTAGLWANFVPHTYRYTVDAISFAFHEIMI